MIDAPCVVDTSGCDRIFVTRRVVVVLVLTVEVFGIVQVPYHATKKCRI